MDNLDAAAAALIAGWLPDERDLASLRCTNRFWRDALSNNPGLWSRLLASRFGTPAPTSHGSPTSQPASSSGSGAAMSSAPGSPVAADPERRFRQLAAAALRRPAAGLERLIWLDGSHLQVCKAGWSFSNHATSAECSTVLLRGSPSNSALVPPAAHRRPVQPLRHHRACLQCVVAGAGRALARRAAGPLPPGVAPPAGGEVLVSGSWEGSVSSGGCSALVSTITVVS